MSVAKLIGAPGGFLLGGNLLLAVFSFLSFVDYFICGSFHFLLYPLPKLFIMVLIGSWLDSF